MSNSRLGMVGGEQIIRIADGATAGNVMHEIGHSLGLEHEHVRTDRDTYVYVYFLNIQPDFRDQFEIDSNSDPINEYDYGSIMHYSQSAFAVAPGLLTLAPKISVEIGQRRALSSGDVAATRVMYPSLI